LIILCFDSAVLWGSLLLRPPYGALAAIVSLQGLHVPAIFPAFGLAVSENLGSSNFPRALGLVNMVALPFVPFSIPLAAQVFEPTGSYAGAILAIAVLLLLAGLIAAAISPRRAAPQQAKA